WSFASRLVTGYNNQKTCQQNNQCPFVTHVFGWKPDNTYNNFTTAPGACDTMFTFGVNRPTAQNHATLTVAESNGLKNALKWTEGNGPNPYTAFQATASTVSLDPTGQVNPPGQDTGAEICQKAVRTGTLNGTPCTCADRAITNGQLINDQSQTP